MKTLTLSILLALVASSLNCASFIYPRAKTEFRQDSDFLYLDNLYFGYNKSLNFKALYPNPATFDVVVEKIGEQADYNDKCVALVFYVTSTEEKVIVLRKKSYSIDSGEKTRERITFTGTIDELRQIISSYSDIKFKITNEWYTIDDKSEKFLIDFYRSFSRAQLGKR